MPLGPVHWGSYPGEYLELAMAVMVAQDHPDTLRRTPARGDGGIDLLVPDGDGYEVQQVKSFTGRVGRNERRQIKQSWDSLRDDPRLVRPITAYRLVVPIDPTPDEQEWFERLVATAPWPATWHGETYWHNLASLHPHVVDYMFGGGRERVRERSMALQTAIVDPNNPLKAVDVIRSLDGLRASLNKDDPHYRYEVQTSATLPEPEDCRGYAMVHAQRVTEGAYFSVLVTPKHRYALLDSPIRAILTITNASEGSSGFHDAYNGFLEYVRPLTIPPGMASLQLDAPSGLGGSFDNVAAHLSAAPFNRAYSPFRLVAVADGADGAELVVKGHTTTTGPLGGSEIQFADNSGIVHGACQLTRAANGAGVMTMQLGASEIAGKPVVEAVDVLRFLKEIRPGAEVHLRRAYGNQSLCRGSMGAGEVDIIEPEVFQVLEDLGMLQSEAAQVIIVPETIQPSFAQQLRTAVCLWTGEEIVGEWGTAEMQLPVGVTRESFGRYLKSHDETVVSVEPNVVEVQGEQISLGQIVTSLKGAQLAADQPADPQVAMLSPRPGAAYTQRSEQIRPT